MKVDLLTREMVDSDLGVVNAARCSFDKESKQLTDADTKLITYLATHQHWTPFAHAQETFRLTLNTDLQHLFLFNANLAGFEWQKDTPDWIIKGSLYAWLTNLQHLPLSLRINILSYLQTKYPVSTHALTTQSIVAHDNKIKSITPPPPLEPITLRLNVPIFVKRQLETHRRNMVLTDVEDFSQNEVSRRYVDKDPEMYVPNQWRLQSPTKKQGSSDAKLGFDEAYLTNADYYSIIHNASFYYREMNKKGIAHEQSRMILPLATYTTFWWTGSATSWRHILNLRLKPDVQHETREVAEMIANKINLAMPIENL